jgi:anthranilate synthase/aminodeoxychorismate synthase-like glutamine amidotransferase
VDRVIAKVRGPASGRGRIEVLIVDNYDSFTYNTVQLLGELGADSLVVLNDQTSLDAIAAVSPQGILLSAGPGTPDDAGITLDVIRHFAGRVPLLGVCLGHQAIAQAFGGRVVGGGRLMHGKTARIEHDGDGLFRGLAQPAIMARYNSLLVEELSLPADLEVTARSSEGEVMGLRHRNLPIEGVQFHPESVLSEGGNRLLANWLERLRAEQTWSKN